MIKDDILEWRKYHKLMKVIEKLKKFGEKALTSEELEIIADYLMDDEDMDRLDDILKEFPEYYKPHHPPRSYAFIDDCYGSRLLTAGTNNPLSRFYIRHRHHYTSISILVQAFGYVPRVFRNNSVLITAFPTKSIKDSKILYEELSSIFDSYEHFESIMKDVEQREYGFLYADTTSTKDPDMRIGFEEKIM